MPGPTNYRDVHRAARLILAADEPGGPQIVVTNRVGPVGHALTERQLAVVDAVVSSPALADALHGRMLDLVAG